VYSHATAEDAKGKKHPTYDVTLVGRQGTARTRSFRFGVLRTFEEQARSELGSLRAPFPENKLGSKLWGLSDAELDQRASGLAQWVDEFLSGSAPSPLLHQAAAHLFQVDERQLFGRSADPMASADTGAFGRRTFSGGGGGDTHSAGGGGGTAGGAGSPGSASSDSFGKSSDHPSSLPIKTGYLSKEGHVVRSFKRRFFALYPAKGRVYYFESEQAHTRWAAAGGGRDDDNPDLDFDAQDGNAGSADRRRAPSDAGGRSSRSSGFGFGLRDSSSGLGHDKPKGDIALLGVGLRAACFAALRPLCRSPPDPPPPPSLATPPRGGV
jgi:hypothetical protein